MKVIYILSSQGPLVPRWAQGQSKGPAHCPQPDCFMKINRQLIQKRSLLGSLWWPSGSDCTLSLLRAQVQSLVRELKSPKPWGRKTKRKQREGHCFGPFIILPQGTSSESKCSGRFRSKLTACRPCRTGAPVCSNRSISRRASMTYRRREVFYKNFTHTTWTLPLLQNA